jgi:two-component system sensor histidine kinase TctE
LLAAAFLVVWGVQRVVRPLEAFHQRLADKAADDFLPTHPQDFLSRELGPLIETLNTFLDRLGRLINTRNAFWKTPRTNCRRPLWL